jgi:hypothetical protein
VAFWLGSLITLVVTLASLLYIAQAEDPSEAATIVATVIALLGASFAILRWSWVGDGALPLESWPDIRADALAHALYRQWSSEAYGRGIAATSPVKVRWQLSTRAAAGEIDDIVRAPPPGAGPPPVPGAQELTAAAFPDRGFVEDLHELYAGLPSGRLVVLGEPGTGKTSATVLLLLTALRYRESQVEADRHNVPVPVLLTLAGWNPAHETLEEFAARRLARDYSVLRAPADDTDIATRLIQVGRVALFLDGLDEMPPQSRPLALKAIDQQLKLRLVLTSRPDEYEEATAAQQLHRSTVIELLAVDSETAGSYLLQDRPRRDRPGWEQIVACLRGDPDHPLARALDTPLMLTLVRAAYPPGSDPTELLDPKLLPTTAAMEQHLLDQLLPSAYRDAEPSTTRYTLDDARRWLTHIAEQMSSGATYDLTWPHISRWIPPWVGRGVFGLLLGTIVGCAAWLAAQSTPSIGDNPLVPLIWGVGAAGAYSVGAELDARFSKTPVVGMILGVASGVWIGLLGGLAAGLWLAPKTSPVVGLTIGFAAGVLGGLAAGLAFVTYGMRNVRVAARRTWPASLGMGSLARTNIFRWTRSDTSLALLVAMAVAFGALALPRSPFLAIVVAALGMTVSAVAHILMSAQSDDVAPTPSPQASLRSDFFAWAVLGVVFGVGSALTFGLAFDTGLWAAPLWVAMGFVMSIAASHTMAYCLAVVVLWSSGQGPLRLLHFLEDAHEREVLRRVGGVYQFRHARLQDRLAELYQDAELGRRHLGRPVLVVRSGPSFLPRDRAS